MCIRDRDITIRPARNAKNYITLANISIYICNCIIQIQEKRNAGSGFSGRLITILRNSGTFDYKIQSSTAIFSNISEGKNIFQIFSKNLFSTHAGPRRGPDIPGSASRKPISTDKKAAAHMRRSSIIGIRKRLSSGSPDSVFRRPGRSRRLQGDLFSLLQACIYADKAFDLSGFATG